eukprot:scaffold18425_cov112-Isochrysis_galbana.AAC.2
MGVPPIRDIAMVSGRRWRAPLAAGRAEHWAEAVGRPGRENKTWHVHACMAEVEKASIGENTACISTSTATTSRLLH